MIEIFNIGISFDPVLNNRYSYIQKQQRYLVIISDPKKYLSISDPKKYEIFQTAGAMAIL